MSRTEVHVRAYDADTEWLTGPVWAVSTPYDPDFVAEIKAAIHPRDRSWLPTLKVWVVRADRKAALREVLGEVFGDDRLCAECRRGRPCAAWTRVEQSGAAFGLHPREAAEAKPPPPPPSVEPTTLAQAAALLGVGVAATAREVKAAFARAALREHPDHGGTDERMKGLLRARQIFLLHLAGQSARAGWR
jgi:hypothetical protein